MPHCNMHRFYRVSEGLDCEAVFRVVTSTCRAEEEKHTSQAAACTALASATAPSSVIWFQLRERSLMVSLVL